MTQPTPPSPPRRPQVLTAHGDRRVDDWGWLADRDDPAVLAHLEAENAYTEAVTTPTKPLQERLYAEMVARIKETDLSVPVRKGRWSWYTRTEEGQQYAIHCRRAVEGPNARSDGTCAPASTQPSRAPDAPVRPAEAPDAPVRSAAAPEPGPEPAPPSSPDQVVLDENQLAAGHDYFSLGALAISPAQRLMAWAVDTTGAELHTLRIRDLDTGQDLPEVIEDVYYGLAWAADEETLFYTRTDAAMRPYQLWRHRLGTPPEDDVCVRTEGDERFYLDVGRTKDDAYILVSLASKVTTETWFLAADRPTDPLTVIEPRRQGIEYAVEHHAGSEAADDTAGRLLIVTNDEAENFRLMSTPVDEPGRANWSEVMAYDPAVKLDGLDVFANHLALFERAEGTARIRVMNLADGTIHPIEQPEAVSTAWGGANAEIHSTTLRYEYSSLMTPRSVYDYDMGAGTATLLKRQPVLGGYDPARYRTSREWATGADGVEIPISLMWREDTARDGTAPALLYGYGAYEHSVDPTFSSLRLSLVDRGFVFALAHVRGGGEMGRGWYEAGHLEHKANTFADFIACARHLVDAGWTTPARLVARGGSAGGLLIGAVANLAPEAFCAMVAEVPFVDCLTTMMDDTLPLTVLEWEEWGNPRDDPAAYAWMKAWSPYDNVPDGRVAPRRYPRLLVTAGLNDPRVSYWEPAKWVARLRAADPANQVLLKVELGAGHMGPSGRYEAWREEAGVLAFVLTSVGINE